MKERILRGNLRTMFTENQIEIVKRTMGQLLIIMIAILVTFSLANAKDGPVAMSDIGVAAVSNVVDAPEYTESSEPSPDATPAPKVQYVPGNEDFPILEDKTLPVTEVNGSTYLDGEDQVISPQSSIEFKNETIEELDTAPVVLN